MTKRRKLELYDIKIEECFITWRELPGAMCMYLCYSPAWLGPVGFVWGAGFGAGQGKLDRFDVLGSYTIPRARRQGVRTLLNKTILEQYHVVTTQAGSPDGGTAFLKSNGYKLDTKTGQWYLRRRR